MKISRYSVQHPVVLMMILIALAVFGLVSLYDVNIEFMADINTPQVYVFAIYPGASGEDIEETVINVMENDFVTLQNYKSMSSQATNSVGVITISFADGVDAYEMLTEVRNRITDLVPSLPEGLSGTPTAMVGGADMLPIITISVSGGSDMARLSEYVDDDLIPQFTRLEGVSNVDVFGSVEPEVMIKLNLDKMDSRSISVLDVYQVLSYSNLSIPLGNAEYSGNEISMRYDGSYDSLDEIRNLTVGATEDGIITRLGDIADVYISYGDLGYSVSAYGEDVIVIEVCKRSGGNSISIINNIKEIIEREEQMSSGALSFSVISDDSQVITSSLSTVIESGILGIIIAVLVIFIFLNDGKATLVIGLSIPLSVFFTFIGMKVAGLSVNLMSISGIVVSLGAIVDASIVVLDQVYKFYQKKDEHGRFENTVVQSIYKGTDVVDKSVIGSNFTTIVVFIPLAMLTGIVGMILFPVTITFMLAIASSLVVAIIFIPFFLKLFLKDGQDRKIAKENVFVKGLHKLERFYRKAIGFSLNHGFFIVFASVGLLLISLYLFTQVGFAFIPSTDNNDFYIKVKFPYGYSLEDTKKGMERVESILLESVPELDTYICYAGKSGDMLEMGETMNAGNIHAVLVPVKERERDIHEIIRDLQYKVSAALPGADVSVKNGGFDNLVGFVSGGGGYGLTLVGSDTMELYENALRIEEFLKSDPEVISTSINSNYDSTVAVLDASYDYLSSVGLTSYEAGMTTAILFNGMDMGIYTSSDGKSRYDIRLESDIADQPVTDQILNGITLTSQNGSKINFSSIADFRTETELSQVNHIDRSRTITVSAQLVSESTFGVSKRVNEYLKANPLPSGVSTRTGGIGELIGDSIVPMMQAGLIGIFLVYMVMVIVFERFKHPILIMITIPFCVIGVMLSLAVFSSTLNMVSLMGVISLSGMLVNNGIILVDYMNQLQESGRKKRLEEQGIGYDPDYDTFGLLSYGDELDMLRENIKEGTTSRLRPILMSNLTTILGVIPMAIAKGEGAEVYAPLGQVIMGGLTTGTFLTLFVMPVFYYWSEKGRMRRKYRKKRMEEEKRMMKEVKE